MVRVVSVELFLFFFDHVIVAGAGYLVHSTVIAVTEENLRLVVLFCWFSTCNTESVLTC